MRRSTPPPTIINEDQILSKQQRPKCRYCETPLRPQIIWNWTDRSIGPVARMFTGRYGDEGDDEFCNKKCGYEWALSIAKGERKLVQVTGPKDGESKSQS